jgi:hypothetical protein
MIQKRYDTRQSMLLTQLLSDQAQKASTSCDPPKTSGRADQRDNLEDTPKSRPPQFVLTPEMLRDDGRLRLKINLDRTEDPESGPDSQAS